MKEFEELHRKFHENVQQVIVGHERPIRELFVALFTGGHVLLEGVPGIAKTLLAKTLARSLDLGFCRIQFTPDLMPSDIVGTNVFNFETRSFVLVRGPIFTDVLLCDEINRTPPKTQAALLEAMEERQVTIDGKTQALPKWFFVIATQNPLEHEGTYPLPEAQLDRFLMKIRMHNARPDEMKEILKRHLSSHHYQADALKNVTKLVDVNMLEHFREEFQRIRVDEQILGYVADLHAASHANPNLASGISPRAAVALLSAAKVYAATFGRDFVTPDDIKDISYPVLRHRLFLKPDVEFEGGTAEQVLVSLFEQVKVPR